MSREPSSSSPHEQKLHEILAHYIELTEAGNPPDRRQFIEQHCEFAGELREFFADRSRFEQLARTIALQPEQRPAPPTPAAPRVRYFGDYELLEEIARGGMGIVYKARQVSLNRTVALKMILSGQFASANEVQRFRAEAEAAANLDHPNIVPIYEVGEHEGQHYFSMKLVEAGTLSGQVNRFRTEQELAAQLIAKTARAVHYAHQRGILHRDIKPSNILLDAKGEPQITDFGLAKRVSGDPEATQTGAIMGTPAYMPPEQARSARSLTTAADIYSLGAVLYHMLTGRPPFVGESAVEILHKVMEADPDAPSTITSRLHRDLEIICLKCLRKEPAQRYATAEAVAEDLEHYLRGEPIEAKAVTTTERIIKWARRRPAAAALIVVSLLALVALAVTLGVSNSKIRWALGRESEALRNTKLALGRESKALTDATQALAEKTAAQSLSRSRLAQDYFKRGTESLEKRDVGAALLWFVAALKEEDDPASQRVLRTAIALNLARMPKVRAVLPAKDVLAFSEDGKSLIAPVKVGGYSKSGNYSRLNVSELMHLNLDRGQPRPNLRLAEPAKIGGGIFTIRSNVSWLEPAIFMRLGGPITMVAALVEQKEGSPIRFWDVATGKALGTTPPVSGSLVYAVFSGDKRVAALLFETKNRSSYHIQCFDTSTGQLLGKPIPVPHTSIRQDGPMHLDDGGKRLAMVWTENARGESIAGNFAARVWDTHAGELLFKSPQLEQSRTQPGGARFAQAWLSPDGTRLMTVVGWNDFGVVRMWDVNLGTAVTKELFQEDFTDLDPRDAVGGFLDKGSRTYVARGNAVALLRPGNGEPRGTFRLPSSPVREVLVSPDERLLAVLAGDVGSPHIHVWNRSLGDTGEPALVASGRVERMLFSPDSARIAISTDDGLTQVRDVFAAPRPVFSPNGATIRAVSADGRRIALTGGHEDPSQMPYLIDLATSKRLPGNIMIDGIHDVRLCALNQDGSRLAIVGSAGPGRRERRIAIVDVNTNQVVAGPSPLQLQDWGDILRLRFALQDRWLIADVKTSGGMRSECFKAGGENSGSTRPATSPVEITRASRFSAATVSEDGTLSLVGSSIDMQSRAGRQPRVLETVTGKSVTRDLDVDAPRLAMFSPDARFVIVQLDGNQQEAASVMFDSRNGRKLWTLSVKNVGVFAFSPDSQRVAIWADRAIRIHRSSDGVPLSHPMTLEGVSGDERSLLRFTSDGLLLVAATGWAAGIWDARSGERLCLTIRTRGVLSELSFLVGDGQLLMDQGLSLNSIDLRPDPRHDYVLEKIAQVLSGRKLDESGAIVLLDKDAMLAAWKQVEQRFPEHFGPE